MTRVATAVVLIPVVILVLFRAPLWLLTLILLVVGVQAAREYLDIAQANGLKPFRRASYVFVACVFVFAFGYAEMTSSNYGGSVSLAIEAAQAIALLLLVAAPFILLVMGMGREPLSQSLPDAAVSFLLLPYVAMGLASIVLVRAYSNGALFLLFSMILVWVGDTCAYYVGRAFGRHKLAPRVSPGKSWEGTFASAAGAVIVAVVLFHYVPQIYMFLHQIGLIHLRNSLLFAAAPSSPPVLMVVIFALCLNVVAQLGDLVESMLKRGGGIKDSGTLLPGHGGLLDRIDALLFSLPVAWFFYTVVMGKYFRGAFLG